MTAKLIITRGLPASGKTTWAQAVVRAAGGEFTRVNRDDIRSTMFGAPIKVAFDYATERAVTAAQQAAVRALLGAGRSVIVDDTNLRLKFARQWADLAVEVGAEFIVEDRFLDVPLAQCLAQDAARPDRVGDDVIRGMYDRFLTSGRRLPPVTPTQAATPAVRPYVRPGPGSNLLRAWLVDIDGTLALMDGRRPYDWHRVGEDRLNAPVAEIVHGLERGAFIVLMSGRDEVCRAETENWLARHGITYHDLFMRKEGDMRKDSLVKDELFEKHVRDMYDVVGVIDDRDQVVRMWRAKGLTVAQVAEGRF